MIAPKNLYAVAGRATNKTTMIQAGRFIDISYDMPHSYTAWCATTYMDAMDNIVPVLIEGLKMHGWKEGRHFVTDQPPPNHFKKPYKAPKSYKHTISTFNGTFTPIVSMDQVTAAAGNSYQHLHADELKNIPEKRIKKLTPAIRGGDYLKFSRSTYYRGRTFTTDMPNITENEHDYILEQEKNMNKEQMQMILQIALVMNEIKIDFMKAYARKNQNEISRIRKKYIKWKQMWYRARKDSTLFLVSSTFANLDILTQGYFEEILNDEGTESFKTTILTLKPNVKKGERFYINLGRQHFYDDGVNRSHFDKFNLIEQVTPSSEALKYCDRNEKLEVGLDFGNMCSCVVAQPKGSYLYVVKEFFTLAPKEMPELCEDFRNFFRNHKEKVIDAFYDRSGNQNSQTGRDWASDFKYNMENHNGSKTGWRVNLMSIGQGNILQSDEYLFMKNLLGASVKELPRVMIDQFQCSNLKSSLELTKIVMKKDRKGSATIGKDKTSEKLALDKLPMYSTNFSDAFKYLCCRKKWMKYAVRKRPTNVG